MIITTVTTDSGALLPLGRQGEHGVRQVWFDLAYLIENFGEGTAMLVYQRNKDLAPYIVSATQTGNNLMWTIDETDTAYEGFGKAEIRWTVDDDLAKTVIYKTNVQKSLTEQTEIPEPLESWYDEMIDYIDQLKVDSDARLVEAVESASESATNASASATDASASAGTATTKAGEAAQSATQAAGSATAAAESAEQAAQSAETAQQAASDAAEETAEAIRTEMSGYADSAQQSAESATQSAESAAQSAQALSGMTVTVGATDKGSGIVEINATVNRG